MLCVPRATQPDTNAQTLYALYCLSQVQVDLISTLYYQDGLLANLTPGSDLIGKLHI